MSTTTNPLRPFLERQGIVILDGGLATTLEARGHTLDSKLWSAGLLLNAPDAIREVHRDFLEAGADCIATVAYQASFPGFAESGLNDEEAVCFFERSVELAVETRDAFWADADHGTGRLRPLVVASVGPYGAYLTDGSEYDGRYGIGPTELDAFHRRRFQLMAGSDADLIGCETLPSIVEAEVLLGILADTPDAWAWMSFSCRDGAHLNDGTPVAAAARLCEEGTRVAAIGVNCAAPGFVRPLIEAIRDETSLPILVYPNSGEGYDAEAKAWTGTAERTDVAVLAREWVACGAGGVGGCCRIGPDVIRALRGCLVVSPE